RGELGGRGLNAVLDATLDADGLQGFVSGADDSGLEAVGAFVLDGGRLQGQITSEELALDALSPGARVALAVNGPVTSGLDGLQLSLSVTGDGPVRLTTLPGELGSAIDLRGELTGTLDVSGQGGPAVRDLSGALGPVTAAGAVLLSPFNAELALSLAPTPLSLAAEPLAEPVADSEVTGADRLSATVAVPASSLSVTASGVSWNGTVTYSDASAGPARLAPGSVEATLSVPEGGQWSLVANSPTGDLVASADANGFAVDFTELLVVLDDPSDPSRTSTPSLDDRAPLAALALSRSEEHTSELQ